MNADVRLPTIHAARGFAAMMVLAFHVDILNGFWGGMFGAGGHGVDLFFVISGFVMVYAHEGEHGVRAAWRFCRRRIIRIYPPYWVVMFAVWGAGYGHSTVRPLAAFFLYDQGTDAAIMQQAWTLSMELAFYIFFLAFFFVGKRGFAVLSAGWVALVFSNFLHHWYTGLLLETRIAEFFMGALGAYIVSAYRGVCISGAWPLGAFVLLCAVFWLDAYGYTPDFWSVLNFGPLCMLLITTGALWDLWRRPRYPRWVMVLGDASYAIYLVHYVERKALHYVVNTFILPTPTLSAHADSLICLGIAMIAFTGVVFHWWIERPMVRWLNARVG